MGSGMASVLIPIRYRLQKVGGPTSPATYQRVPLGSEAGAKYRCRRLTADCTSYTSGFPAETSQNLAAMQAYENLGSCKTPRIEDGSSTEETRVTA